MSNEKVMIVHLAAGLIKKIISIIPSIARV